jgi:prepilin peptidase CpaA
MWSAIVTVVIGLTAAIIDWRTGKIPNWLTLPALALAPLVHFAALGGPGLAFSVFGLLGCGLLPYFLFRMDAMGGGDVKLLAALGAWNGLALGGEILLVALLLATAQAVVTLVRRKRFLFVARQSWQVLANVFLPASRRRSVPHESMTAVPLGPAICAASILVIVGAWV